MDAQAELGHAPDRMVERPALGRQGAQVVRVGRHDGEDDAGVGAARRERRLVDRRVAVVDAVDLEHVERGLHVGPRHAELAGVRGGLEAGAARCRVGGGEQLGRPVDLAVVDADADHLVDAMRRSPSRPSRAPPRDRPRGRSPAPAGRRCRAAARRRRSRARSPPAPRRRGCRRRAPCRSGSRRIRCSRRWCAAASSRYSKARRCRSSAERISCASSARSTRSTPTGFSPRV